MHRPMKTFLRAFAVFAVMAVTADNTQQWLCHCDDDPPDDDGWAILAIPFYFDPPEVVWKIYEHAYFSYRSIDEATRFPNQWIDYECSGLRYHVEDTPDVVVYGVFAAIALVFAILWSRSIPSGPLRLPLGAEPLPPEATTRNNRRLRGMAVRSGSCLTVTLLGAFHGLAFAFGLLGWWYGSRLCGQYEMLGRRPHWMAVAASKIGAAMVFASILILIGILLH